MINKKDLEKYIELYNKFELDSENTSLGMQVVSMSLELDEEDINYIEKSGKIKDIKKFRNDLSACRQGASDISKSFWEKKI